MGVCVDMSQQQGIGSCNIGHIVTDKDMWRRTDRSGCQWVKVDGDKVLWDNTMGVGE